MFRLRRLGDYDSLVSVESSEWGSVELQRAGYHTGVVERLELHEDLYAEVLALLRDFADSCHASTQGPPEPFAWEISLAERGQEVVWSYAVLSPKQEHLLRQLREIVIF